MRKATPCQLRCIGLLTRVVIDFSHTRSAMISGPKRVLLHCGFHKTGTTSIQRLLRANQDNFPKWLMATAHGHQQVVALGDACRMFDKRPDQTRQAAVEAAWTALVVPFLQSPADCLVVSSENVLGRIPYPRNTETQLYPQAGTLLRIIAESRRDLAVVPVLYLRDAEAWRHSLFKHLVRTRGLRMTAESFVRHPLVAQANLSAEADQIEASSGMEITRFHFEDDLATIHGLGTALLTKAGCSDADLERLSRVGRANEGARQSLIDRMSAPPLIWLPRPVRLTYLALEKAQRKLSARLAR